MRKSRGAKLDLDLFPFLSVLCGVIGVMMLFIMLITASRVFGKQQQDRASAPPPDVAEKPKPIDREGITDEEFDRLSKRLEELVRQLAERQAKIAELRKSLQTLEELIASKEGEVLQAVTGGGLLAGVPLEVPDDVEMVPDPGSPVVKKPLYVLATDDGFVVQPGDQRFELAELNKKSSPLRKILDRVDKNRDKEYVVILVDENGVKAFQELRSTLQKEYASSDKDGGGSRIQLGWEPFSEGWRWISQQQSPEP